MKIKKEFSLYDYQQDVINWMQERESKGKGGIICLKMGLGKTLISLEFIIKQYREKGFESPPTLIIASKSLIGMWKTDGVEKFYDSDLKVLYFHKDYIKGKDMNEISLKDIRKYHIVITTYDMCAGVYGKGRPGNTDYYQDLHCERGSFGLHEGKIVKINQREKPRGYCEVKGPRVLYEMDWERIICDESAKFSNPNTKCFKSMMGIYGKYKWCLTGTPIKNYGLDIWSQLVFCKFDKVEYKQDWKTYSFYTYNCREYLFTLSYDQANVKMPELKEVTYSINLSPKQELLYKSVLKKMMNAITNFLERKDISYSFILTLFLRLRQICISPRLMFKETETIEDEYKWVLDDEECSPKIIKLVEIVKSILKEGEKVLIFSSFVTALESVKLALEKVGISSDVMTGKMNIKRRQTTIDNFKKNSDMNVLLLHYKVGGEGLNLTEANHVIPLEPWWNHATHKQGIFRAWRRGQTKTVIVHWLLVKNTIEERIMLICEGKESLSEQILNMKKTTVNEKSGLSINSLMKIIQV